MVIAVSDNEPKRLLHLPLVMQMWWWRPMLHHADCMCRLPVASSTMTFRCYPRNTCTALAGLVTVVEAQRHSHCVAPLTLSVGSMWNELNASN